MHTVDELRRFTVARNFPIHTSLRRALQTLGSVQADPDRAPARAQGLIMRHRVNDYQARYLDVITLNSTLKRISSSITATSPGRYNN